MTAERHPGLNRRRFLTTSGALIGAAVLATPALAQGVMEGTTEFASLATNPVRNNISSFTMKEWRDYFDNLRNGAILADLTSRAVHFWSEDESIYRLYPWC